MTTEVLTPENTCLWTSHVRNDTLLRCHKKSSFQTNTCQNERHDARSYDKKKKKVTRSGNVPSTISPR